MVDQQNSFDTIEKEIRRHSFAILSTVSPKNYSQSTGVLYAVSSPQQPFVLYVVTGIKYKKVKNIEKNPHVSVVIPIPHHIFRFVPANTIAFQATARILPFDNPSIIETFQTHRALRMTISSYDPSSDDMVFLEIIPSGRIHCYGVGKSLMELRRDYGGGSYTVIIPKQRLSSN